jgi:hypothetical protein
MLTISPTISTKEQLLFLIRKHKVQVTTEELEKMWNELRDGLSSYSVINGKLRIEVAISIIVIRYNDMYLRHKETNGGVGNRILLDGSVTTQTVKIIEDELGIATFGLLQPTLVTTNDSPMYVEGVGGLTTVCKIYGHRVIMPDILYKKEYNAKYHWINLV